MKIRSKIWLESDDGEVLFGGGRLKIFQAVDRCGSLNAAAKELGMSYRALWGKVRAIEERIGVQLIDGTGKGSRRGGATLTESGQKFVSLFEEFEKKTRAKLEDEGKAFLAEIAEHHFNPDRSDHG